MLLLEIIMICKLRSINGQLGVNATFGTVTNAIFKDNLNSYIQFKKGTAIPTKNIIHLYLYNEFVVVNIDQLIDSFKYVTPGLHRYPLMIKCTIASTHLVYTRSLPQAI